MSESSFEFTLTKEIMYQTQEGSFNANKLLLIEPSLAKYEDAFFTLKGYITTGLKSQQNNNQQNAVGNQEQQNDVSDFFKDKKQMKLFVMVSLNSLDHAEYKKFREIFYKDILCGGCCLIDGKIEMTKSILDNICLADKETLIGEYCANFLLPSWLAGA